MRTLVYNKSTRSFSEKPGPWYITLPLRSHGFEPSIITAEKRNREIVRWSKKLDQDETEISPILRSYKNAKGPFNDKQLATDEWIKMCIADGGRDAYEWLPRVHQKRAVELKLITDKSFTFSQRQYSSDDYIVRFMLVRFEDNAPSELKSSNGLSWHLEGELRDDPGQYVYSSEEVDIEESSMIQWSKCAESIRDKYNVPAHMSGARDIDEFRID